MNTHCPQGHEYTVENTRWSKRKNGKDERVCKACAHAYHLRIYSDPEKRAKINAKNVRYHKEHPEVSKRSAAKMRDANREKYRTRWRASRKVRFDQLRKDALIAYGNRCAWCGDTEDTHLQFDHVNNDGHIHRKQEKLDGMMSVYAWMKKHNYPKDRFQILCANCHNGKSFYGIEGTPFDLMSVVGSPC